MFSKLHSLILILAVVGVGHHDEPFSLIMSLLKIVSVLQIICMVKIEGLEEKKRNA